jgi:hypothetical protein
MRAEITREAFRPVNGNPDLAVAVLRGGRWWPECRWESCGWTEAPDASDERATEIAWWHVFGTHVWKGPPPQPEEGLP